MSFTMVYYHIPEDFDDPEQPNAFGIGKALDEIKLTDVKRLFPVIGTYHFRFKFISGKTTIWMDLNSDESKVISVQGKIIIKATRISWDSPDHRQNVPAPNLPAHQVSQPSKPSASSFNLFEFDPSPAKKKADQFDLLFPS